jgi:hypothetical protein
MSYLDNVDDADLYLRFPLVAAALANDATLLRTLLDTKQSDLEERDYTWDALLHGISRSSSLRNC